jgi:hypothetical protein
MEQPTREVALLNPGKKLDEGQGLMPGYRMQAWTHPDPIPEATSFQDHS